MNRRALSIAERLRAESMNAAQPNRALIIDAHNEIKILSDETMRAYAKSVMARQGWERKFKSLRDTVLIAMQTLSDANAKNDDGSTTKDPEHLWNIVTQTAKILLDQINALEGDGMPNAVGDDGEQEPPEATRV